MAQPPTAAIVVASIFGGIAALFFGYRIYKKWWNWRQGDRLLPPVREPPTAYYGQTAVTPTMDSSPYASLGPSTSRASMMAVSPAFGPSWSQRNSQASHSPSERPSPVMTGVDIAGFPSAPPEAYDAHSRAVSTMSSSSSTMTLKRSYASSTVLKSSSASQHSLLSAQSGGRRESYLPHSPLNRDSIQIVPPQPLGFGLGSYATATDQRTLAFSRSSGIGQGDDFGSGLVWGPEHQHDISGRQSVRSTIGEDERRRYLQQGPLTQRSTTPSNSSSISPPPAEPSPAEYPSPTASATQLQRSVASIRSTSDGSQTNLSTGARIDEDALQQAQSPLQRVGFRPTPSDPNASFNAETSESPILAPFRPTSAAGSKSPPRSEQSVPRSSPPGTAQSRA